MNRPPSAKIVQNESCPIQIGDFNRARAVLRSEGTRQAGFNAELLQRFSGQAHIPVLYQEGEAHQRQRSATARFFAPRVVATRYRALMERLSDELVSRFRREGRAQLDALSLELSVAVAADIIGLTNSPRVAMGRRLGSFFTARQARGAVDALIGFFVGQYRLLTFYIQDVRPAIRARRFEAKEDLVSHLLGEEYSDREILTECLTYAAAGMATTREFIVMTAIRMLENKGLRVRFLEANEDKKMEILQEILRLEPVVSVLKRRIEQDVIVDEELGESVFTAGSLVEIDVRKANRDATAAGLCPDSLDFERVRAPKIFPSLLSFGDGSHRCPGASVALQETMIFLERLLRVPGIRLDQEPTKTMNPITAGYELRGAIVSCSDERT